MKSISNTDKAIIELWKQHESVKMVEQHSGYTRYKIMKCLSTHGYILNTVHQRILQLHEQGKTADQIAKSVGLSAATVKAYLPRVRPEYGQHYSKNAQIIYNWRKRKESQNESKKTV